MAKQYSIADVGREFQKYGLRIGEHPEFGKVGKHAPRSYHYAGQAIDVTDWRPDVSPEAKGGKPMHWKQRTSELTRRARESGLFTEVLGPGDKGHDTHLHLALKDTIQATPQMLQWIATGRYSTPEGKVTNMMPLQQKDSPLVSSQVSAVDAQLKNEQKEEKSLAQQFLTSFIAKQASESMKPKDTGAFSSNAILDQLSQPARFMT